MQHRFIAHGKDTTRSQLGNSLTPHVDTYSEKVRFRKTANAGNYGRS